MSLGKEFSEGILQGLLALAPSLSPISWYSTLFFINNLNDKEDISIKFANNTMPREIDNGTNDRNNVWNDWARTNGSKRRIWHLIEIHKYRCLDSKTQLKMSSTQLERRGCCLNSTSYEKNIWFQWTPRFICIHSGMGLLTTSLHAADKCCSDCGTWPRCSRLVPSHLEHCSPFSAAPLLRGTLKT